MLYSCLMRAKAFTLMELVIVTVIIGILAAFAIPSYEKAMARQKVKRLIMTANLLTGAQEIYKARNGRYWCDFLSPCSVANLNTINLINAGLDVSVIPEDGVIYITYAVPLSENQFFRLAITDGALFLISFDSSVSSNINCANLSATPVCP